MKIRNSRPPPQEPDQEKERTSRYDVPNILQAVRFVRLDSKLTRSVLPLVELAQDISKWRRHSALPLAPSNASLRANPLPTEVLQNAKSRPVLSS